MGTQWKRAFDPTLASLASGRLARVRHGAVEQTVAEPGAERRGNRDSGQRGRIVDLELEPIESDRAGDRA